VRRRELPRDLRAESCSAATLIAPPLPPRRLASPPRPSAAQERQREAAHIASAAVEVNEAFKDLGGLVAAQGETLAAVEATVDASRDTVVKANKDLVLAASYQRSYRKKCCIFWLLLVAVAVAIIVPVVLHFAPPRG